MYNGVKDFLKLLLPIKTNAVFIYFFSDELVSGKIYDTPQIYVVKNWTSQKDKVQWTTDCTKRLYIEDISSVVELIEAVSTYSRVATAEFNFLQKGDSK